MESLDAARDAMPDLTVSTDIIVGFCGETETQFAATRAALQRGRFDLAFIAQYSTRPGAVAERFFADDVPKEVKKQRDQELTTILAGTALANNEKLIGRTIPVLVDGPSRKPGRMLGRTEGLKSVEFTGPENLVGEFVDLEITAAEPWRLQGQRAQSPLSAPADR
jgi:tRNA-2-methylthio-N6-dimethylallyladenosine synthase